MRVLSLFLLLKFGALVATPQVTGFAAVEPISRENRIRADSLAGDSVDAGTGAFLFERTVMSVQGGRVLTVDLSYNSLLTDEAGALGPGWSHPYEAFIDGDPDDVVTVHWDANRKNSFRFAGSGSDYEPLDLAVQFDKLFRNSNGTWRLTLFDGTIYEFDSDGRLERLGNKIRQFLEVSRDSDGRVASVREPIANRRVFFKYRKDRSELLQHLQDAEDRVVFFDYDSSGRLIELRDPVTLGFVQGDSFSPKDIPDDNPTGLTHLISVEQTDPIGLVMLFNTNIGHSRPSDLDVSLTSPEGTTVTLELSAPGPSVDLTDLILDQFDGENPQGTWRVRIIDQQAGSTGRLNGWRMMFTEPTDPYAFTYSGRQLTSMTGPEGSQIFAVVYDSEGRVNAQDDGVDNHNVAEFEYESRPGGGVITRHTDRTGATEIFEHDANYNLRKVTDALGNSETYAYDAQGNRIRTTDALGRTTQYAYDANGNLTSVVDPAGFSTTMQYDSRNNLTRVQDALGKESRFQYNTSNNLTRTTDAMGHQDTKSYSGNSQMTGNLLDDGAGINYGYTQGMATSADHPVSGTANLNHDNIGRPTRIKDGDGHEIRMRYNSRSQIIERTDQLGNVSRIEYDRRGRRSVETDARGNKTRYSYDGNDNLVSITNALGETSRLEYDGEDRLLKMIDSLGNESTRTYDAAGRIIAETDALGNTVRTEYDAVGNEVAIYDAKGNLIERTTYDERDFPVASEDALGSVTTNEYDAVGRLVRVTDPLGRVQTNEYDDLDRPIGSTDPLGRETERTYLQDDVTRELIDPRGNGYTFRYDPANRMSRTEAPWGSSTRFSYNNRDLVTEVSYPSGRGISFAYDDAGRTTQINSSGTSIEPSVFFNYDENGNLTKVETKAFQDISRRTDSVRTFDGLNRMTSFTDVNGDTIRYAYSEGGELAQITYPDGSRVRYTYDDAGQLTGVTDWAGRTTTYEYDENGRITRATFPNGAVRIMDYDVAGQVIRRRELTAQGQTIVDYRYSYDAGGQTTVESSAVPQGPYQQPPVTMTYASGNNRLLTYNGQSVSYDNDGFLTEGPLGDSTGEFTYDNNGNLIRAGQVNYGYDAEDRLVRISNGSDQTTMTVNPMPELWEVLMTRSSTGGVKRYVWGRGLLYEEQGGDIRVYHYDQRGSTVAFTDENGQISGRVSYGPYGEVGQRTGDTDSLFLYGGLFGIVTDPNGLNFMRYRWYHPQIKRFLSEDARFGDIDDPTTLNRYAYVGNNPVMRIDPNGQFWHIVGAAVGAAVFTAAADLIFTGKLGPPSRYVAAAGAGAAIAACPSCGFLATVGLGTAGGAAGGFVGGGLSEEGFDVDGAVDAAGEGAILGAEMGLFAGGFKVLGRAFGGGSRAASAGRAGRGGSGARAGGRGAGRAGRAARAGRGGRAGRGAGRKPSGLRGGDRAARSGRGRPSGRHARRGHGRKVRFKEPKPSRGSVKSEVSEVLPRQPSSPKLARKAAARTVRQNRLGRRPGSPGTRSRPRVQRQAGRQVNAGRGQSGEQRHWAQVSAFLAAVGKPPPNNPNPQMSTF